jgi:hypothetical protein
MLIPERRFAPKLKVILIEHPVTWLLLLRLLQCSSHLSFIHAHKFIMSHLVHTWNSLVHIHAIGVPRIMIWVKSHKAWTPEVESVREPEVQSDKTGGDVGAVREAEPKVFLCQLRQALEHYKPPTFKAINYICYIYIVALSGKSRLEPLAALYHSLSRYMNPWILCRQDRLYA